MSERLYFAVAGVHDIGPLTIVIHDDGVTIAWRRIVRLEYRRKLWSPKDTPTP